MLFEALIVTLTYHITFSLDALTGTQGITRPILLGPIVGLVCGDLQTGIILGAELEAIYMGMSSIGGTIPSEYRATTCLTVAMVILSGVPMETGLALSVTVGILFNALKPFNKSIKLFYYPIFVKLAEKRNYKGFRAAVVLEGLLLKGIVERIALFFAVLYGTELVTNMINLVPSWVMDGLNVSAEMLVVIGLCLIAQSVWQKYTPIYILIGFILAKFFGLGTLVITLIAVIIAVFEYKTNKDILAVQTSAAGVIDTEKGDDFFD